MNNYISVEETDAIGRLGLDDLRNAFSANPPAGTIERAKLALKVIGVGTGRMSAENSRRSQALKIAKVAGIPADQVAVLWHQMIAPPSGGVVNPEARPEIAENAKNLKGATSASAGLSQKAK